MAIQRILFLAPAHAVTRVFPSLRDVGFEVGLAENVKGATAFIRKSEPGIIFARPALPGFKVEDLLAVGEDDPSFPPIIVITDKGTPEEAVRYMSLGAMDYWLEPLDVDRIVTTVKGRSKTALSKAHVPAPSSTLGARRPETPGAPRIVGSDPSMRRVLGLVRQVAASKASVLISGASGTGKELFARTLHAASGRTGPFIAVNCAALPEHLLESELFGHEKGAFTGAIARKLGKFELADRGTLLLDEISEMDLALQAKLLRVLQEGEIDRVGGTEAVRVDVRIVATTNRNMETWVNEEKFRQDLFFRLNVIPLRIPSLSERGNDLEELANFFIQLYVKEYALPPTALSDEAKTWLFEHDWPGNVRELQNLMERAVLLAAGRPIVPGHFLLGTDQWPLFEEDAEYENQAPVPLDDPAMEKTAGTMPPQTAVIGNTDSAFQGAVMPLHEVERLMIMKGLQATSGNRTQAAELLGISVRTLRNKLNEYRGMGLQVD